MSKRILGKETDRINVSAEKLDVYKNKLSRMLSLKTVFRNDFKYQDEFNKFYQVLDEEFPLIKEKTLKLTFGSGCFIYVLRGKHAKKSIMLMSHHDVVDETPNWNTDPFKATEKDGYLYARGSVDTKTPLFAELEALEELLGEGYDLDDIDLYIASSNNEEVGGDGMVLATEYFKENNIVFDVVLDEGGAILSNMIPGYVGKSAMVAVHEKSRHLYKLTLNLEEVGHGGLNQNDDNVINRMTSFINEVNNTKIYKAKFYDEVEATFKYHVPYMKFPMNFLFKNLKLFSPIIKNIMTKMPQAKPMLTTSLQFTTLNAGNSEFIQSKAKKAEATMFLRCVREDDLEEGLEKIKSIAKKYNIKIDLIERDYCKPTNFNTKEFKMLTEVLNENFPDVVVAPFLLTAGTDARRLSEQAKNIYRFAPIDLSSEQFKTIHGDNENISIKNVGECVCFYKNIIKKFNEEN